MKKVLYLLCMIVGGLFLFITIVRIPAVITRIESMDGAEASGYVFGSVIFGIIGFFLVRFGYRKFNPKTKKEKVSIDDLGKG